MKVREVAFTQLRQANPVTIACYEESSAERWDEFVTTSNNGTLFHLRRFLRYHPPERFEDVSLIFEKERKWLSVMPAAVRQEQDGRVLISHPGASFAGPVFKSSTSIKDTFFVVQALVEFAKAQGFSRIVLTLPPLVYLARPSNYLEFALREYGFTYLKREVSSVIPLDFAEEDTLFIFSPESRRAARKAMKSGVKVRESEDFESFYSILKRNLTLRHNVQPTHTLEELLRLKSMLGDKIRLFGAFLDSRMIAGVVMFTCNSRVALAFYISHLEAYQQYRSVNLLFYEVVRWAIRQRFRFLDFGIFTVQMKPNWGLARFKESFGAQGVFRDTLVKIV
ncbi:MAG: GNAT family N-acetyltransferase [Calditrichaeota bacterium]|nr:MAG: GNAT family N-acetyltransferase [Calditrichota bacterium]